MKDKKEVKDEVKKKTEKEVKEKNKAKIEKETKLPKQEDKKDLNKTDKKKKVEKKPKEEKKELKQENKKEVKKEAKKEAKKEVKKQVKQENKKVNKSQKKSNKEEVVEPENDLTFKKVEIKEEKKKHGFLKFILILVIILIGAYCVFFSRNFIILNNIYNQMCEIGSSTNYSYEMVKKQDNQEILKMKYYKKDNVERVDLEDQNHIVNTITDIDSKQVTTWSPKDKTASIYTTEVTPEVSLPLEEGINNQETRAFMGLTSIIYTEEYNSKECYVILQIFSPNMISSTQKTWIDKETGLVVKREYLNCVVEYNNVEMNNVKNIDTPDLRTYKVEKEN